MSAKEFSFSHLLLFSLGLLVISVLLTVWSSFAWSWSGVWFESLWLAMGAGAVVAVGIFVGAVFLLSHRWLRLESFYQLTAQLHQLTRHLSWPQIVLLSLLAGVGEELLFRGALQSWLSDVIGVYTAIVLASLIFALLHALTLYYFLFTFVLSIAFGLIFHYSQSMVLLMSIHGFYDILALGVIAKCPHWLGLNVADDSNLSL